MVKFFKMLMLGALTVVILTGCGTLLRNKGKLQETKISGDIPKKGSYIIVYKVFDHEATESQAQNYVWKAHGSEPKIFTLTGGLSTDVGIPRDKSGTGMYVVSSNSKSPIGIYFKKIKDMR